MCNMWYQNVQSRFIKNREAKGLLTNLGVKTLLSKVPILGDILFWMCMLNCINEQNKGFIRWWCIYAWNTFKTTTIYL